MPDLNLIDDEGLSEEMPEGAEEVMEGGGGGGGGASKVIIILLVVLIALVGGVYALNTFGIINLWGNNQPQVMTVEEPFQDQFYDDAAFAEQPVDTSWMTEQVPSDVALLETTPLDEGANQAEGMASTQVEMLPFEEDPVEKPAKKPAEMSAALKSMKGDFTIQVVAYREEAKAAKILSNLEFSGYPAFIERVQMKGGDWYTVRIGKYATRAAAREAVQSFASSIRENYFIDKIRSQ